MKKERKNNEYVSPVKTRQIELLKKYYEVDEENKKVKIKLAYEKASELFTNDYASEEHPEFQPDIIGRVTQIVNRIPLPYKADIEFAIDDYEGHDPKSLLESFNDAVEMNHYGVIGEGRKKGLQIALLLVAGIVALVFKVAGETNGWFGEGSTSEIISEIIDIAGWVFVWESVSIMFLSPSEERLQSIKLRTRVSSISFVNEEKEVLANEDCVDVFDHWAEESRFKRLSKIFLLIGGTGFIGTACSSFISTLVAVFNSGNDYSPGVICLSLFFALLSSSFSILAGIAGISAYSGRDRFKRFIGVFGVFCLIVSVFNIVASMVGMFSGGTINVHLFITGVFSFIFYLFYGLGWLFGLNKE